MTRQVHAIDVLLVEDNPGDVRLTQEALKDAKVANRLHLARDGVEALEYLRQSGEDGSRPRPDLVLLDLNLPRMSGREVLQVIKADPELKRIPVVVLTTSQDEADVLRAYELHANCYISKPVDLDRFMSVVRMIEDFWLTVVRLPT